MNAANWNLDELVGKVMADLRAVSSATSSAVRADKSAATASAALSQDFAALQRRQNTEKTVPQAQKVSAPDAIPEDDAFVVSERLLVAETVRRLASANSTKRWRVRSNVVVTPSARDELKKAGVELFFSDERRASNVSLSSSNVVGTVPNFAKESFVSQGKISPQNAVSSSRNADVPVFLAVHLPTGERFPKFVEEYLTRNFAFNSIRLDCLKETSKKIAAEIENNKETRTVLTTRDAAIGSIWTNRLSGVRAVVAFSVEQAKRDIAAADANVVIVDPSDVGPYPFRQIVEFFLTRGRR